MPEWVYCERSTSKRSAIRNNGLYTFTGIRLSSNTHYHFLRFNVNCRRCSRTIETERLAVIATELCGSCARRVQPKRVRGAMVWNHKTAPVICVMTAEHFENDWTKYCPKYGMGSGVHAMSPRAAGTA